MTTYDEARKYFLATNVGSDNLQDEWDYLATALVVTEGLLNDLQLEWLAGEGITSTNHNDAWIEWYDSVFVPVNVSVYGAGTDAVNGTYAPGVDVNLKVAFYKAPFIIQWTGVLWEIREDGLNDYYTNASTADVPPKTGWILGTDGAADAPTLRY